MHDEPTLIQSAADTNVALGLFLGIITLFAVGGYLHSLNILRSENKGLALTHGVILFALPIIVGFASYTIGFDNLAMVALAITGIAFSAMLAPIAIELGTATWKATVKITNLIFKEIILAIACALWRWLTSCPSK